MSIKEISVLVTPTPELRAALRDIQEQIDALAAGPEIQFLHADGWIAMYVDGSLVDQGHELYAPHLFKNLMQLGFLNMEVKDTIEYTDAQMDAIGNHFPDTLDDLILPEDLDHLGGLDATHM